MTDEQKKEIQRLRRSGAGYKKIAEKTGISINTVKTFCRRRSLAEKTNDGKQLCMCCGKPLIQTPGRREKKFCSDTCRTRWWSKHRSERVGKNDHLRTCAYCGKEFSAYGEPKRKYCSHACYIADRFGGDACE